MRDIIFCAPLMVMIMHKAWHKFQNEFYTSKSNVAHILNTYFIINYVTPASSIAPPPLQAEFQKTFG